MTPKECIILAGGMGTRLRSEVADLPKSLAPVAGKPFLYWLTEYLLGEKLIHFHIASGYLHQEIEKFFSINFPDLPVTFSKEDTPLGTGGAVKKALQNCREENVLIVNGDTFFNADIKKLMYYHVEYSAACTIALKEINSFDRYGTVETDEKMTVISFREKMPMKNGFINGGMYMLNRSSFQKNDLPEKFSFEKDYLETQLASQKIIGIPDSGYFIDIGIPEDFKKANNDFEQNLMNAAN